MAVNADSFNTAIAGLFEQIAISATYTPKATGVGVSVKVLIKELGTNELVEDYRQGDLKCYITASYLSSRPLKYDRLTISGRTYTVKDNGYAQRGISNEIMAYKFIVRGG